MGKFRSKRRSRRVFVANQHAKIGKNVVEFKAKRRGRPRKNEVEEVRPVDSMVATNVTSGRSSTPIHGQSSAARVGRSRSSQKISKAGRTLSDVLVEGHHTETGYRLMDMEVLSNVIKLLGCPECHSLSLKLKDDLSTKNGFANHLTLDCQECCWSYDFFTSKKVKGYYEVNKRFAYAMRCNGKGYTGCKKFCAVMNIPTMPTKNNFSKLNKSIKSAVFDVAEESMKRAGAEVRNLVGKECGTSVDGCWQKRGYVSLNGCVSVLSMDTGKVVDVEPMSRHCKGCETHLKLDKSSAKFKKWQKGHTCKANFDGSAPAMEPEGAKRIFARSQEKHGLLYTKFCGDGDSKSFPAVEKIYKGEGKMVEKLECIGHVQKRMGTALRKLKREKKGLGGRGKLTDKMVDKIQNYYGIAIRSNVGNLEAMKKAVLAVLFHCASSAEKSYHNYCPDGKDSWCGFKADKANISSNFKPGQGLPLEIIGLLKPIFANLSRDELLRKCLHGQTQNQNESFHRVIWDRVPKSTYVGRDIFETGIYDAVSHFNDGARATISVLQQLGLEPGHYSQKICNELDASRIYSSEYREKESSKLRRKKLRGKRKAKGDKYQEKEGETYGAGQF